MTRWLAVIALMAGCWGEPNWPAVPPPPRVVTVKRYQVIPCVIRPWPMIDNPEYMWNVYRWIEEANACLKADAWLTFEDLTNHNCEVIP